MGLVIRRVLITVQLRKPPQGPLGTAPYRPEWQFRQLIDPGLPPAPTAYPMSAQQVQQPNQAVVLIQLVHLELLQQQLWMI